MKTRILGLLAGVSISVAAQVSGAALGDQMVGASSTSTGRTTLSTKNDSTYTVSDVTENNVHIRQYINSSGRVFAISWRGEDLPDLDSLLGSYLPEYQTEVNSRPKTFGRRSLKVSTKNIVVEGFSRQRAQGGRAYIPASLPAGFDVKEIKFNE